MMAWPGCSDDSESTDDGGADDAAVEDAGADADADGEADAEAEADVPPTGTLAVLVIGVPLWINDPVRPPIAGAAGARSAQRRAVGNDDRRRRPRRVHGARLDGGDGGRDGVGRGLRSGKPRRSGRDRGRGDLAAAEPG
ncbi:MAG: hypothetical protein M0C28_11185 [Candidatus Moduliflexus flocculans]|nr:hypothetical protein [Candidatus Moduliflexus flocculans]